MVTVGTSRYTYEVIENWGSLPEGWSFGVVGTVAVDSQDRVYAFQRKDPPILVFDREGNFLSSWGNGAVLEGHGIYIGSDDMVYLTDVFDHVAMKYTLDGKPMLVLGDRGQHSDTGCEELGGTVLRPGGPFNAPSHLVVAPSGEMYASDGYRNCRVHMFTARGQLITSWGVPGKDAPGEFHLPHAVWVDREGTVYVCDRENCRIQVFSATGEFINMWTEGLYRPTCIYMDDQEAVYVSEFAPLSDTTQTRGKISIWDKRGNKLAEWDAPSSHWIYGDSRKDLYVAEAGAHGIKKYVRQA